METNPQEPALNEMAERIAVFRRKGVPRHDQPAVRRYYESATVLQLDMEEADRTALADAAQASEAAVSWDYLDCHPRFLRLVYLGVAFPLVEEALAAVQLAQELRQRRPGPPLPAGIFMGRLFYMQDHEDAQHRSMAGLLLQALPILTAASREDGHIMINDGLHDILQERLVAEEMGMLDNAEGIPLKAYRLLELKPAA